MSKYPSQMQDKFNLRFPDGMRDAIAERAKANGRSMNSEIVQILEDALTQPAVKVQSEFNVDLYAGNATDSDKITMSRKQLLEMVNRSVQQAIDATADSLSKGVAEATFNALSEKYDFVPKNKKPT
ncbi:Arc family DNA-binding protein [Salmonella enterica subsp. enterica]|uniref:Arc family DNA-binding protein n=1 Tax=Salmonella enterica TaxID=28901 RepID=UPI000F96CB9C|nr:Arc family DNA-binding protein [Salmonella enterica subsp. enterica]EAX7036841.1 Arc family DNA-binding protein [Salmonella enterica]EBG0082156.1 Arc family DNA-binding protein [Salmonella enterica subsp. enterica serovar Poona]ECT9471072.1 Arc family DNA-binding protein [Salmonella enterica subsp. enterica serovar Carrau]EDR7515152.1 Arc family DNA-binding protein [Salmonella enterica subsp. enterica serovar Michigan]EDT6510789.1 Arc family DNA-binding protein [Salmonella enterica subsp. e